MTLAELRYINRIIRAQTLRFCRGMVPSLDEASELATMLAHKTHGLLVNPRKVNFDHWNNIVGNTVVHVIAKEVA